MVRVRQKDEECVDHPDHASDGEAHRNQVADVPKTRGNLISHVYWKVEVLISTKDVPYWTLRKHSSNAFQDLSGTIRRWRWGEVSSVTVSFVEGQSMPTLAVVSGRPLEGNVRSWRLFSSRCRKWSAVVVGD